MLIGDLRTDESHGVASFLANLRWEGRSQDRKTVQFTVEESDAWRVSLSPDAYGIPGRGGHARP